VGQLSRNAIRWLIAGATGILLLGLSPLYGYHRDELYFIEAGERLAWGYVDQPPLTPFVARLAGIFDHNLFALRLIPALTVVGLVLYATVFVRRFGGGRTAELLAAGAVATGGAFLVVGHFLSTTTLDFLFWVVLIDLVCRIVEGGRPKLFLAAGVVAGVGLLNKWTLPMLLLALGVPLLFSEHRRVLRSPMLWLGLAVAALIVAPNVVWQAQNDWPFFDMAASLRDEGIEDANTALFVPWQVAMVGPVAFVIAIRGLLTLMRDEALRTYRFLGWTYVVLLVAFTVLASKPYFLMPLYVPLIAVGAVVIERSWKRGWAVAVGWGLFVSLPISAVIGLPVMPPAALAQTPLPELNPEVAETYGWPQLVEQVDAIYEREIADGEDAIIFTLNYGEAGAIDLYGPGHGLPRAYSGHNNYSLWGPPTDDDAPVLIVGHFPQERLEEWFAEPRRVGVFTNPADLENEEFGAPVFLAEGPLESWRSLWPKVRHYN
jgi:4-amino-4-deoxy-L-arabinose transferase-like glycosyltransferase